MFSGSSNPTVVHTILSDLTGSEKSKMSVATPEVFMSPLFCTYDGNAIPTAKRMFSGYSNQTVIPIILSDLTGSNKSKMAVTNPEVLISALVHMMTTQF